MACVGSQFTDSYPPTYFCGRRPALIPPDCMPSAAETEEPEDSKIQQPLVQPAEPCLFRKLWSISPPRSDSSASDTPIPSTEDCGTREQSPSSTSKRTGNMDGMPKAITRDPRRRAAYLKARAQYARDRMLQQILGPDEREEPDAIDAPSVQTKASLRNPLASVINQEMNLQFQARADTPHLSEVSPGEDVTVGELEVQGLAITTGMAKVEEDGRATKRSPSPNSVTSIPDLQGTDEG